MTDSELLQTIVKHNLSVFPNRMEGFWVVTPVVQGTVGKGIANLNARDCRRVGRGKTLEEAVLSCISRLDNPDKDSKASDERWWAEKKQLGKSPMGGVRPKAS